MSGGVSRLLSAIAAALLAAFALGGTAAASNDTVVGASGPILNGQTYEESIATENDVDWWVFYTGASTALDVALLGLGPDDCFGPTMNLTDANGEVLAQSDEANRNETEHILYTVGPGTFYVQVLPYLSPCVGFDARYRIWINSSPSLLSAPPYIPPPAPPVTKPPPKRAPGPRSPAGDGDQPSENCQRARAWVRRLQQRQRRARYLPPRARQREQSFLRHRLRRARDHVRRQC